MALYDTFDYSAGYVVLNVFSLLFCAGNLAAMASNLPGMKKSSDKKKSGAEGHYYSWGVFLGVRSGDLMDAYTQFICLPMKLACWVPLPLCQVYAAFAEVYWGLNMIAVSAGLVSNKNTDLSVKPYANMVKPIFLLAILQPFTAVVRFCYFVLRPEIMVSDLGTALIVAMSAWYVFCAFHAAHTCSRAYGMGIQTTVRYMNDLWLAHEEHLKKDGSKWDADALHPEGFDPLKAGPQDLLKRLRDEENKPLSTAEEINDHIEKFLDENTTSLGSALAVMVLVSAVVLALPPVLHAGLK